jgi:hypothetical protein
MAAALLPVPVESVWTWRSRGAIHGAPGTERIAAPDPAAFPNATRQPAALATAGINNTLAAPQFIMPPLYYQTDWPEHAPVRYLDQSHELPVPSRQEAGFIVNRGMNTPGGINQFSPGGFLARMGGGQIVQPTSIGNAQL